MKRILGIAMLFSLVSALSGNTQQVKTGKTNVIDLGKGVKLEMVLIPAAEKFKMGSPKNEKYRDEDDEIQHEVTLTKPFFMGKYEITQDQWQSVMGSNPSSKTKSGKVPVTDVTWSDCQEFIKKLNEKTNGGYRLPRESEWEYSCRAGSITAYSFGDKVTPKDANYKLSKIEKPVAVGSYKPNNFGLYDMHGNVSEWCEDWFGAYRAELAIDPNGPATPAKDHGRVVRGGNFLLHEAQIRSSYRGDFFQNKSLYVIGFRLAKTY